ncbi:exonuclease SbcCD subunit D [Brevibacillus daliensis]|uniref:exonuclease SbcCD subunit D n=1 Tax=Brevibacillus daliensis TaxID=2892995 RepID=UPI001E401B5E|nr:exonuclease SbcCD subunit D [Brevibacillus daliensis]
MRILHTADWHFGRLLEGRDRRTEQEAFVEELCQIATEKQVDLVLIAGDIYDSVNPPAWAEELFYHALERLSDEGRRGVVVIAGNHDQPERVRAASPLATKHGIVLLGLPKETPFISEAHASIDKVRIMKAGQAWLEMAIPGVEHHAVILALPYPSEARLKELISESLSQEQMQEAFSERIKGLFDDLEGHFRDDTVNLVTSHLFAMGGSESDSERPIQIGGTHTVSLHAFPKKADYVALGHLHRLQKLSDSPLIRYSGSPLAYSFSEAGQSKAVVLIEIVPGEEKKEEIIYLQSGRPLARWKATQGIAQVEEWLAEGKDANAWIDLEIHVTDTIDPAEFQRIRKLSDQFVKVQRVRIALETEQVTEQEKREELGPVQLFCNFYERKRGTTPDDTVIQLFSRLMSVEEKESEGGRDE